MANKKEETPQVTSDAGDTGSGSQTTQPSPETLEAHSILDTLETDIQRGVHWTEEQLLGLVKAVRSAL
jgi:hypothetical protein